MKRTSSISRDKERSIPIHQRIRQEIERRILSGEWPPGHRIPYEHELMAEFGCARMTVSKALTPLAAKGLIVRKRHVGSVVAVPVTERTALEIQDFQREAEREGRSYGYQILSRRMARLGAADAARLSVAAGKEALKLECLHEIDGRPITLEQRSIMLDSVPDARSESFSEVPPGSWLLSRVPWTDAEHVIRAIRADRKIASRLGVRRGAACLVLDRHTWLYGNLVTEVRLIHPGEYCHLIGRFGGAAG